MRRFVKTDKNIIKRIMAFGVTGTLILSLFSEVPYLGQKASAATNNYGLSNPVLTKEDGSGTTTWDSIYFGHYLQEDTNGDGTVDGNDEKQPIKWRVLSVDGDDAFLMADQGLDRKSYNSASDDATWETSSLRSWLNGYDASSNVANQDYSSNNFINTAFTSSERNAIDYTVVINEDNPDKGTEGGSTTVDRIYLLSIMEASNPKFGFYNIYSSSSVTREMNVTAYVATKGLYTSEETGFVGNGNWWLRSPGDSIGRCSKVDHTGNVCSAYQFGNMPLSMAVRPVLHLNLSNTDCWSYAGRVSSDKQENIHDPQVAGDGTVTWDCVYFGHYLQEDTNGDGTVDSSDTKQPIKWRVLSVDGDDAFLMADQGLDCQPYNETGISVTWETCTLRSWLNGYDAFENAEEKDYSSNNFINTAFTAGERSVINYSWVVNDDNPSYGTEGGNSTADKVYLLSIEEASTSAYGFNSEFAGYRLSETREMGSTVYAEQRGASVGTSTEYAGNGCWWLRSPGHNGYSASYVGYSGCNLDSGDGVSIGNIAVRPVLHLNLSSSDLWSYGGTVSAKDSSMAVTASPIPTASAEEKDESVTTTCPAVTLQPTETPQPALTPTPVTTEKPDEENQAFLMFTDKDWRWGNWYTRVCGGYGRDTVITGNGTYTVSIHKSDFPDISEVNNPANGANVFLVDIMGICDTQKFDASGMAISDVVVKCDGNEIKTDLSKMYEGDIEGKGNYFLEIRNEYGYGNGDFATKEEFDEMNPDFTFSDSLSVTFTITGIKEGKTPADAFKTADGKSVVEVGGKRAQEADMPEITQQPGIVTYAPVTSVSPGKVSALPKTTSGTVTGNKTKTTASPKKTSTPDGKKWKVSSYKAAAGYTKKSGYLLKKAVKLTWKAANGVDGYYIYRREGSAGEKKLATLSNGSDSSYEDSSVEPGKSYTYRVLPYHVSETGNVETGAYSSTKTIKIGTTLKKPKISAKVKGTKLTLGFVQAEGEQFETQYRWMNEKKWKKQTKIQGRLKKNINKKINAKGFMLRVRSYVVIDGKKKYSKWSAPVKIR